MQNPTVVFPRPREVALEDRARPEPKRGEVLIRSRRTLISTGTELTILNGEFPADSRWAKYGTFPFTPGYDNVGEVVAVGDGVDKSWIGKVVASYVSHALYGTTPVENVQAVPASVPAEQAVFFTIAQIVMNGVRRGRVQWGEAVAVFGAGLLGQLAVRFCRIAGARPAFVVDVADSRLQRLPQDGAILRLNPQRDDVPSIVREATRGRMADVVLEVTGNPAAISGELRVLKSQGRCVILSSPRGRTEFDFHDDCNSPSFEIIGAHNGSHPPHATPDNPWTKPRHNELFFDLVEAGELDVAPLISHRAPCAEAPALYHMLLQDRSRAMGVVLEWS